jgi:hypothetical protein
MVRPLLIRNEGNRSEGYLCGSNPRSEMSILVVRSNAWLESHQWLVLCSLDDLRLRLILSCGLGWRVWCGYYPGEGVPGSEVCQTFVLNGMNKHIDCGPISDACTFEFQPLPVQPVHVLSRLRAAVKHVKLYRYNPIATQ